MASNGDIGSVLLKLQDLKTSEYFSDEAGIHIDAVVSCIKELYDSTAKLRSDHETATIQSGVLRHKLADMRNDVPSELNEAVDNANNFNKKETIELKEQIKSLQNEIEKAEEDERKVKLENERLFVRADGANQMWPKMTNIVGSALRRKSIAQLYVNDTRCKTMDVHRRAISLGKEAEEMCQDVEDYWNYCYVQMSKIKADADRWKQRIVEQDERTEEAKSLFAIVDQQVRESKMRLNSQEQITNNLNEKAELARAKKEKQKTILANKKKRFQEAIEERDHFQQSLEDTKIYYKEVIQQLRTKENTIENEIEKSLIERRELIGNTEETRELLNDKKNESNEKIEDRKMQKTIMVESNNLIGTVLEDAAGAKAEREKLKKKIAAVLEDRDLTRKSYSREIEKLNEYLDKESSTRQEIEAEYELSLEDLDREERQQTEFMEENKTIMESFIAKKELLKRTQNETQDGEHDYRVRKSKIEDEIEMSNRYYEITIVELRNEIEQAKIRVQSTKELVAILQEKTALIEPLFLQTKDEFRNSKKEHDEARDKTVELNRKYKDMCDESERSVIQTVNLEKEKKKLQQELEEVNHEVIQEIQNLDDVSLVNLDLHKEMKQHDKLFRENNLFSNACEKLRAKVDDEKTKIDHTEKCLSQMEASQENIQQKLVQLIVEEMELTDLARERDEELIDDIAAKKNFSDNRRRILEGVTDKMSRVLSSIEKLQSEDVSARKKLNI
uniref:interaptin-like n=1 Tax=Styela clava TaxID=7725 RepID=UPI00193A85A7|nr:interaptin-like [Styela clava]